MYERLKKKTRWKNSHVDKTWSKRPVVKSGFGSSRQMVSAQIYFAHVASTFTSQVMPLCISRNVYRTASRPHDPAEYKYEMSAAQFFYPRGRFCRVAFHEIKNIQFDTISNHV